MKSWATTLTNTAKKSKFIQPPFYILYRPRAPYQLAQKLRPLPLRLRNRNLCPSKARKNQPAEIGPKDIPVNALISERMDGRIQGFHRAAAWSLIRALSSLATRQFQKFQSIIRASAFRP